jgi:hypothetical protein
MRETAACAPRWHPWTAPLIGLTLVTSAVHFVDNAFRLDLYPGPAWLTRNLVLTAWFTVLLAAFLTYRKDTRTALVAYGVLGFGGLAHYFMLHENHMPTRCTVTIGADAVASVLLVGYALFRPPIGCDKSYGQRWKLIP